MCVWCVTVTCVSTVSLSQTQLDLCQGFHQYIFSTVLRLTDTLEFLYSQVVCYIVVSVVYCTVLYRLGEIRWGCLWVWEVSGDRAEYKCKGMPLEGMKRPIDAMETLLNGRKLCLHSVWIIVYMYPGVVAAVTQWWCSNLQMNSGYPNHWP